MNVHPIFNTKKVRVYVARLVIDYEYKHFSDLTFADKCEFAALLIEAAGSSAGECLTESTDINPLMSALAQSLKGEAHDDIEFLYKAHTMAVNYYSEIMEDIFYAGLENYNQEKDEWLMYAAKQGCPDSAHDKYMESL